MKMIELTDHSGTRFAVDIDDISLVSLGKNDKTLEEITILVSKAGGNLSCSESYEEVIELLIKQGLNIKSSHNAIEAKKRIIS